MVAGRRRQRALRRAKTPGLPARVLSQPTESERLLDGINTLSRGARANWFGLLAYLAFVGVTLLGVEDADFFVAARDTALPLIGVSIPTLAFFWIAPILGAALYVYLHFHLIKLWHVLAQATAEIDGKPLGDRVFPWLVNDLALSLRHDHPIAPQPLRWLSNSVTILLVWVAGPVILAFFWARGFPAHDLWMTTLGGVCLAVSLAVGATSWGTFWRLRSEKKTKNSISRVPAKIGVVALFFLAIFFYGAVRSTWADRVESSINDALYSLWISNKGIYVKVVPVDFEKVRSYSIIRRILGGIEYATVRGFQEKWVHDSLRKIGLDLVSASLMDEKLVDKPESWRPYTWTRYRYRLSWCNDRGIPAEACGRVGMRSEEEEIGLGLLWDHRNAWCSRQQKSNSGYSLEKKQDEENPNDIGCIERFQRINELEREDFKREWRVILGRASSVDLEKRDLRRARLLRAFVPNSDLREVRLDHADLTGAILTGSVLREASLRDSKLKVSYIEGADLTGANLERANLDNAIMIDSILNNAVLRKSSVKSANFTGIVAKKVSFVESNIESSVFVDAITPELEGSNARIVGSNFSGAHLWDSMFLGANIIMSKYDSAVLLYAKFDGAHIMLTSFKKALADRASFQSSIIDFADFSFSSLRESDFDGAIINDSNFSGSMYVSQKMFDNAIGSDNTILPIDYETQKRIHLWSCWKTPPQGFQRMVRILSSGDRFKAARLRDTLLCPPGVEPECRGTFVDAEGNVGAPGSACPGRYSRP